MHQRHEWIIQILSEQTYATVDLLAHQLGVSQATIRRDLRILAEVGLVTRAHGGAMLSAPSIGQMIASFARMQISSQEKRSIAKVAAEFIHDGEVIALDTGSTTLELAKLLRHRKDLTVFTTSIPIAQVLASSSVTVYLLGGELQKKEMSLIGPLALQGASQFNYDHFFMGVAGVDVERGLTDFSLDDVEVKKVFLWRAREITVLADHTKFSRVSLVNIGPLQSVHRIITDDGVNQEIVVQIRKLGIEVLLAPPLAKVPAEETRSKTRS